MHAFVWGVRKLDLRAKRNHVDAGNLLAQNAALEAGMDRLDLWIGAKLTLVYRLDHLKQPRLEVRFPPGIGGVLLHLRAGQEAHGADPPTQRLEG